jgi:hypothetical protein
VRHEYSYYPWITNFPVGQEHHEPEDTSEQLAFFEKAHSGQDCLAPQADAR